jgi:hypothetical protein
MNQEATFADEVVVIIGDGKIVNGLLALNRRYSLNFAPAAVDRLGG